MDEPPSTPSATSALMHRPPGGIARAADVDEALCRELAEAFSRWSRIQLYGMGAIAVAFAAAVTFAPGLAVLVAAAGLLPALVVNNIIADRAMVDEFVTLGLARPLARSLMGKTYLVPEAYTALPATLSNSEQSKATITRIIQKALAKTELT